MTKKWIAINVMLLLCAGLLCWQLYVSAKRFNIESDPSQIQAVKKKAGPEGGLPPSQAPVKYSAPAFAVIPAQNLFSESRKVEVQAQPVAPPAPEPMRTHPVITSIVISGSSRVATIVDPSGQNRQGAARVPQRIRPGDTFQGYVATDITADGILFESGTNREFIPIHDVSKRPAPGGKTPILATRVVNFGPGQAAGGQGTGAAVVGGATAQAARGIPAPAAGTSARGTQAGGGQTSGRGVTRPQESPAAVQIQGGQPQTWNQTVDPQGRVIINSPFGSFPVQQPPQVIKK